MGLQTLGQQRTRPSGLGTGRPPCPLLPCQRPLSGAHWGRRPVPKKVVVTGTPSSMAGAGGSTAPGMGHGQNPRPGSKEGVYGHGDVNLLKWGCVGAQGVRPPTDTEGAARRPCAPCGGESDPQGPQTRALSHAQRGTHEAPQAPPGLTNPLAPQRDQVVPAPRGRQVGAGDDHRVRAHGVQLVHDLPGHRARQHRSRDETPSG